MKFVLTSTYEYWWPVKVKLPNPDPRRAGQHVEQAFKAKFTALPTDEGQRLQAEIDALVGDERLGRQNDLLKRVVISWDESVVDEDGTAIPFTPEVFDQVLTNVWVLQAFYAAWGKSLGSDGGRQGN